MPVLLSTRHPANSTAELVLFETSTRGHNRRGFTNGWAKELWPGFWDLLQKYRLHLQIGSVVIGRPDWCGLTDGADPETGLTTDPPPHLAALVLHSRVLPSPKIIRTMQLVTAALEWAHSRYSSVSLPTIGSWSLKYMVDIQRQQAGAAKLWNELNREHAAELDPEPTLTIHCIEAYHFDKPTRQGWDGQWKLIDIVNPLLPDTLRQRMYEESQA